MDKKHGKSMTKIIINKMQIIRITITRRTGIKIVTIEEEEIIEDGEEEAMVEAEEVIPKIITTTKNKRSHK